MGVSVPRMQRSAPRLRRGALLIRGPSSLELVPALRSTAEEALHRVRDTRKVAAYIRCAVQVPSNVEAGLVGSARGLLQFERVQVWPPQNMPPMAQPWTRRVLEPFSAIVES